MLIFLLCATLTSWAQTNFAGKDAMNGIKYSDYKNFTEKWELVTIRFRKDTGEMRLTYANKVAMEVLKKGSTDYPDGAVFAKTGIHTSSDPQFESSVVPRGIRRYQLMVKNKKQYASTGGWGYGLYDAQGKTFNEDPKVTQDACYACHTIVENRGDVFSEPFDFVKDTKFPGHGKVHVNNQIKYEWREVKNLPKEIISHLGTTPKVRFVTNDILRKNVFQGTFDELKPILDSEARKSQAPALFLASDNKRFVLLIPRAKTQECMEMPAMEVISTDMNFKTISEKYCLHD